MSTGLKYDGDVNYKYIVTSERSQYAKSYFKQTTRFNRDTLKSQFPDARLNNNEDAVKLALVYLLASLLLNNNPTVVLPEFFINLVDNVEIFNNFPWGKVVWEDSTTRIKKQAQNKRTKLNRDIINSRYNLFSFHLPLQVWLYEIFPNVAKNFAN